MHQIVYQLEDVLQSLVLYQAMLLVAISVISAVICFIIGSIHLSKIIVSGRRMIMMKPSAVVTCLTLVACFAGHADASVKQEGGKVLSVNSGSTLNEQPLKGTQGGGEILRSKNVSQLSTPATIYFWNCRNAILKIFNNPISQRPKIARNLARKTPTSSAWYFVSPGGKKRQKEDHCLR